MMNTSYFKDRYTQYKTASEKHHQKFIRLSTLRIAITIIFILLLVFFANERNGWGLAITVMAFPLFFGFLVNRHNKIKYQKNHALFLADINFIEQKKQTLELKGQKNGNQFMDERHEYTADLDIFGEHSLFQLINRCVTPEGEKILADWLKAPASIQEATSRQEAVKELRKKPEWLQQFRATGMHFEDEGDHIRDLLQWIERKDLQLPKRMLTFALVSIPVTLISIILAFTGSFTFHIPAFFIIVNVFALRKVFRTAKETADLTYEGSKALKTYSALIELIRTEKTVSPWNKQVRAHFTGGGQEAPIILKRLDRCLDYINARSNAFYYFFDMVLLLDIVLLHLLDRWKKAHGQEVKKWFHEVSKQDALNSLAGFSFAQPNYQFPLLVDHKFTLHTINMGHPLIPVESRVDNDFHLSDKGKVALITGSNMSGKSTFQRTVGVNLALAFCGAPVCARQFEVSQFQLFTSMRNRDRLEENVSSFYAELQRIRQLLDLINKSSTPVLYALDEVLKGTNSNDRHRGAMALIRQLSRSHAMGLISTHDLELGKENAGNKDVENFSFNAGFEGDRLIFDYKLSSGICHSFNASQLMKQMGIDVED
ncbi:MAG: hypothetical protein OEX02_02705 [Cyclobacteriaceae bacterium]|nr:hypothetical protein [Cyclobacteriaceae bacterium]